MPRIRVLPDVVVNRIAAGEIVERPASVVKELVENSLDAGADRIDVELEQGGRRLVRVTDDGCGMDADDALLALERHATSKLGAAEDLDHIATLGFRGEALPSIAAVARFTLLTCSDPGEGGCRVTVEGGRILAVEGAARPRGTTVEVRDLFFNTPARRKFLHTPETELRHAQEVVSAAALANPDLSATLRHGRRTLLEAAPTPDPAQRLRDLVPRLEGPVHRFEERTEQARVWGLLASTGGSGSPRLILAVNGRPVRDRLLAGAVRGVLREQGGGLGGSWVVLFVELPHDAVDVNVHPAKAEVRFARARAIFGLVDRALRGGVAAARGEVPVRRVAEPEPAPWVREGSSSVPPDHLFPHPAYGPEGISEGAPQRPSEVAGRHPSTPQGARSGPPDTPFGRLIGQYRSSFLLLEDDWGLVVVDQHVAHERVLYDRIRRRLAGEKAPSQCLLEPLLLELDEARVAALEGVRELLGRAGIEVEAFGADTLRITALPAETDGVAARRTVEELLEQATDLAGIPDRVAEKLQDELAASLACRAAVKINHPLTVAEQRSLLEDLRASDNPYRCPHGRPIVLRLSQEEMERRLGRR